MNPDNGTGKGQIEKRDEEGDTSLTNLSCTLHFLVVLDPRALTRQSFKEMLTRGIPDYVTISVASCEDLMTNLKMAEAEPGLILLNAGISGLKGAWARSALRWLKDRLPSTPVVILSDLAGAEELDEILASGVRGYVPTWVDPEVAFAGIRLVLAGGSYIPPSLFRELVARHQAAAGGTLPRSRMDQAATEDLTPRELEVANLLSKGKPNKVIGIELRMQESTVKVHVRNIMKKLRAANRTEVAVVANRLFSEVGEN
jgi:DNA-binding NarL/FixJ family response regulator